MLQSSTEHLYEGRLDFRILEIGMVHGVVWRFGILIYGNTEARSLPRRREHFLVFIPRLFI